MKRILLTAVAFLMFSAPSLSAQEPMPVSPVSINEKGILKKIEKSDSDIVDPKKSGNASTWITRGQVFYDAATEVSKHLYNGMDAMTVMGMFGEPTNAELVKIEGNEYNKGIFPYFDIYLDITNIPVSWVMTKEIYPGALRKSVEAYEKAYQLDGSNKKTAEKVNAGLKAVYDEYSKIGALHYAIGDFEKAGNAFVDAYEISKMKGITVAGSDVNTLLHDAGLAFLFAHDYKQSIEYLTDAEKNGYDQSDIYYLIYHAYRGMAAEDSSALATAKGYLDKGLQKYPTDDKIIASLSEAYVLLGYDPDEIIRVVEASAKAHPDNADMWSSLGVLYVSKENYDKALESFAKMVALQPESYIANNNMGIVYIKKADAMLEDVNSRAGTFSDRTQYDAELNKAYQVYSLAIPFLEKANTLDPSNVATVEMLKNVTFRIRDIDGMMPKYEKYKALLDKMQQPK